MGENNNLNQLVDEDGYKKKVDIFVDHLIKAESTEGGPVFSDEQIRDHALSVLAAVRQTLDYIPHCSYC